MKEISEMIIFEQFLRIVHPDLEVLIREQDPPTAEKAAQLAEKSLPSDLPNKMYDVTCVMELAILSTPAQLQSRLSHLFFSPCLGQLHR